MARKTKKQRPFGSLATGSRHPDKEIAPEPQSVDKPRLNPPSNNPPLGKLADANRLLQAGKLDEADEIFQAVLSQGPDEQAYAGRLDIAWRAQRWEDGARLAEAAVADFPDSILLGRLHGLILLDAGRISDAKKVYDALVQKFPDDCVGFVGLAMVASRLQDWHLAAERWRGCREQFPNEPVPWSAWCSVSEAYARYALNRLDEADALFNGAAAQLPQVDHIFSTLARLAAKRGDPDLAVRRWEDCIERFPDHADVQTWLNEFNELLNRSGVG